MSLQNMNQIRLVPKKDYVANRLVSGALQLAKNTSLYLDETQLEQGQLDTTGGSPRKPQEVDSEDSNASIFPVLVTELGWICYSVVFVAAGVRNVTALGNLISWQKVDYDFNYHQMEFPCNINVLVASEGRSLLPVRTQ